jgi:glycosyltransferase involved in cell wall biosynthesis
LNEFNYAFHNDRYRNSDLFNEYRAYWNNYEAISFDGQNLYDILKQNDSPKTIYVIYSDFCLQINAKLNHLYQIETLALKLNDNFIIIDKGMGIDSFKFKNEYKQQNKIYYSNNSILVDTINIKFSIYYTENEISINFYKVNYFAYACGLIGFSLKYKNDRFLKETSKNIINPSDWIILDNDYFSHRSIGQIWSNYDLNSNIFILKGNFINKFIQKNIKFKIEGQFLTNSGWSNVNRKIYLTLYNHDEIDVFIKCNQKEIRRDEKSVEILVAYHLCSAQLNNAKSYRNLVLKDSTYFENISFIFRNSYPPYFGPYLKNDLIILHQPWEYFAIPTKWLSFIKNNVFDVWVPSNYVKESFISNGIPSNKIQTIPHGVNYEKFQLDYGLFKLPTKKKFKFLTIGGILHRKGLDLLIEAYLSLFKSADDVTLIIHCIYEFYSNDDYIKKALNIKNAPEIIYLKKPLSEIDVIRLFKSVDVYITPYRSEGFGLSIIEAMAAGLPVIVTKYGPSVDFFTVIYQN